MAQCDILNLLREKNTWLKSTQIRKDLNSEISFPALSRNLTQLTKYNTIKRKKDTYNSFLYHW